MVKALYLNDTLIKVDYFEKRIEDGLLKITFSFKVTSEEYHEIATLLYKNQFAVKIPELNISFRGTIQEYSTSITNLYEKGRTGTYYLTIIENK